MKQGKNPRDWDTADISKDLRETHDVNGTWNLVLLNELRRRDELNLAEKVALETAKQNDQHHAAAMEELRVMTKEMRRTTTVSIVAIVISFIATVLAAWLPFHLTKDRQDATEPPLHQESPIRQVEAALKPAVPGDVSGQSKPATKGRMKTDHSKMGKVIHQNGGWTLTGRPGVINCPKFRTLFRQLIPGAAQGSFDPLGRGDGRLMSREITPGRLPNQISPIFAQSGSKSGSSNAFNFTFSGLPKSIAASSHFHAAFKSPSWHS